MVTDMSDPDWDRFIVSPKRIFAMTDTPAINKQLLSMAQNR